MRKKVCIRIEEYIDKLNTGSYEPVSVDNVNYFSDGGKYGRFWPNHKDDIGNELLEPKYCEGYEVAKMIFRSKTIDKIDEFIERLNTGYIPKSEDFYSYFSNYEPFNSFWYDNKRKIISELFTNSKYDDYDVAKGVLIDLYNRNKIYKSESKVKLISRYFEGV